MSIKKTSSETETKDGDLKLKLDAVLTLKLVADSGYEASEEIRITLKQWGSIMDILHPPK